MPTAIKSGNWTDPSVWDTNREPRAGERVIIPAEFTVIYDITFELMLRRIIRDQLQVASNGQVTETSPFSYNIVLPTTNADGTPADPSVLKSSFDAANAIASMWRSVGYNVNLRFAFSQPAEEWIVSYLMSREGIIGVLVSAATVKVLVLAETNSIQAINSAVKKAEHEVAKVLAAIASIEGRTWTAQFFVSIQREAM